LYLNVDYKAIVIKIRHAVLKIFEQLYKIFEQLFQILATFEHFFGVFLSNFLPFSEQNLDAPSGRPRQKYPEKCSKNLSGNSQFFSLNIPPKIAKYPQKFLKIPKYLKIV